MKMLTTTFAAVLLCLTAFGQDWTALESNDSYTIYFTKVTHSSPSDGIDHERIVFRYENHTPEDLRLTFNRTLAYSPDGTPIQQEQQFHVDLPPYGSVGYTTALAYDKTFYIYSKDNRGTIKRTLMDFKLTNLQAN